MNMHVSTAKFKVGDRVRCDDNSGARWDYSVGEILTVESISADLVRCAGKGASMFEWRFSLVEQPTFKIGDRVQGACLDPEDNPGTISGFNGTRYSVKWDADTNDLKCFIWAAEELYLLPAALNIGDRVGVLMSPYTLKPNQMLGTIVGAAVQRRGEWDVRLDNYGGGSLSFCASELEMLPAAPLKIEAGKFYRTRDGRKVGPMRDDWFNAEWRFHVSSGAGTGLLWNAEGKNYLGMETNSDLVAEWTSSCAAAQVDNLRDEYGPAGKAETKFKVGDIVKRTGNGLTHQRLRITEVINDNNYTAEWVVGGPGSTRGWKAHEFELADQPKFKVGDLVRNTQVPEAGVGVVESVKPEGGYAVNYKDTWYRVCHDTDETMVAASATPVATSTPAIVALIENGQPKPADRPHVHPSRGAACNEADRLARKYPGKEFGVYELVDTRQVAKPTYQHEWQRLAADGRFFGALTELRNLGVAGSGAYRIVADFMKAAA